MTMVAAQNEEEACLPPRRPHPPAQNQASAFHVRPGLANGAGRETIDLFIAAMRRLPEVVECYIMLGASDALRRGDSIRPR
jgi:DNA-binding Lrp family transcriptional regulator